MDNLYRLRQTAGQGYGLAPGTIDYDCDRPGNMALKASTDIPDDDVNIGAMTSGGAGGTSGRIGRNPGDPPGPHALTFADSGTAQRTFVYDDNGNMTDNNGDLYTFDLKDRLGKVEVGGQPTPDIRYIYDYTDRRVIKRVDGEQTTYINRYSEIRGQMIK